VAGDTDCYDFPVTANAFQPVYAVTNGDSDAFVTKFSADGSTLLYSTFLGGGGEDYGAGIAVDSAGRAYVVGGTNSTDFPTLNPVQAPDSGEIHLGEIEGVDVYFVTRGLGFFTCPAKFLEELPMSPVVQEAQPVGNAQHFANLLKLTDAARLNLVRTGFDPHYGARPLKRAIQKKVETPLGRMILKGEVRDGQQLLVDVDPQAS